MSTLFDRSLLPPALCEFVVLADTHYTIHNGDHNVEFASRRLQSARVAAALHQIADLRPDFTVHLGDLCQEYPGTSNFDRALSESLKQLRKTGVAFHHVAGNHDVGDKPDPTMPAHTVDAASLATYHRRVAPSYYGFDNGNLRGLVINSQILNSDLPEAARQREFLQAELIAHNDKRCCVFMHIPPYLCNPSEPSLGHYDNIDLPDRSWLLNLLGKHRVEMLFAGHVHFAFHDQCGSTNYWVVPSTSFTRPGFGHLFTGPPAPEQGRNDSAKLGFYLCRVRETNIDVHLIPTNGALRPPEPPPRLLTPRSQTTGHLGITLTHPICSITEVPLTWPSVIRQQIRNDYPLLSTQNLGTASLRVPWTDVEDRLQGQRLAMLRKQGIHLQVFLPLTDQSRVHRLIDRDHHRVDRWELQLTTGQLDAAAATVVRNNERRTPLALCPIVPGERLHGKQHPRTRTGFFLDELLKLDRDLSAHNIGIDAALYRLGTDPWDEVLRLCSVLPLARVGHIDLLCTLPDENDQSNAVLAARALFAAAALPGARLYFDPIIDLDRTMDVRHGILDTLCNPRPVYEILRCLNAVLTAQCEAVWQPQTSPGDTLVLRSKEICIALLPTAASVGYLRELGPKGQTDNGILYFLASGTVATSPAYDNAENQAFPAVQIWRTC